MILLYIIMILLFILVIIILQVIGSYYGYNIIGMD